MDGAKGRSMSPDNIDAEWRRLQQAQEESQQQDAGAESTAAAATEAAPATEIVPVVDALSVNDSPLDGHLSDDPGSVGGHHDGGSGGENRPPLEPPAMLPRSSPSPLSQGAMPSPVPGSAAASPSMPSSKGMGMSPNDRNAAGNTSLHLVAAACSLQGVDLLIQHGADLDARDAQGRSALHIACAASSGPDIPEDLVKRLLLAGSNPNLEDDSGSTPLHVAAANGKEACLQLLLEGGAVSQLNHAGDTPLHISAVQGHLAVMQRLVLWRPPGAFEDEPDGQHRIGALSASDAGAASDNRGMVKALSLSNSPASDTSTASSTPRENESPVMPHTLFGELIVNSSTVSQDSTMRRGGSSIFSGGANNAIENSEYLSYSSDSTHGSDQHEEPTERPSLMAGSAYEGPANGAETGDVDTVMDTALASLSIDGSESSSSSNSSGLRSINDRGASSHGDEDDIQHAPHTDQTSANLPMTGAPELNQNEPETASVWVRYETADGDVYYYNAETETSMWEAPEGRGVVIVDPDPAEQTLDEHYEQDYEQNYEQHYEQHDANGIEQTAWDESQQYSAGEYSMNAGYYDRETAPSFGAEGNQYDVYEGVTYHGGSGGGGGTSDTVAAASPDLDQASTAIADAEQGSQGDSKSLKIWNKFFENALLSHTGEDAAEEAQKAADDDTKFLNTVIAGSLEEAERMILSGISASCVDDQLRTPLHYAAYNGDRDMAALLCDYDADIEAFDASGNTALHVSAARGSTRTLLFLLEYAALVDVQNDVGDTPLHLAVWFGNRECVRHLLDYSASLDMLNSFGLDPYNNVFSRSPLARKKKLPSDLRRSLSLLVEKMPSLAEGHTPGASTPTSSSPPVTDKAMAHAEPAITTAEEPVEVPLRAVTAAQQENGISSHGSRQHDEEDGGAGSAEDEGFESAGEEDEGDSSADGGVVGAPGRDSGPPTVQELALQRSAAPPPPPDVAAALYAAQRRDGHVRPF